MADKFPLIANTSAQQIQEISSGDNLNLLGNSIVGVVSITTSGNVSVGGTITYEDVTNIDSVGVITARDGINVTGGVHIVAGTTAYSDGTFGLARLQFNTKTGNHIGACSIADTVNSITHVLFKNPNGAIASFGTHDSDFIALTGNVERLRITSGGNVSIAGTISDSKGNLRNIPQNSQSSAYSLVAADAGKHVYISSGGVTIPASEFSTGDAITIINNSGSDQTNTCSAVTTYLAGDTSSKSSLTLKGRGVATFLFASATVCYGSGAGLE